MPVSHCVLPINQLLLPYSSSLKLNVGLCFTSLFITTIVGMANPWSLKSFKKVEQSWQGKRIKQAKQRNTVSLCGKNHVFQENHEVKHRVNLWLRGILGQMEMIQKKKSRQPVQAKKNSDTRAWIFHFLPTSPWENFQHSPIP